MKISVPRLLTLLTVFAFAACSTVHVTTDFDHSISYRKYKTYSIAPAPRGQHLDAESEAVLRSALRTQLAEHGMTEVKHGKGDLAIVPTVFTQERVSQQQYTNWGFRPRNQAWPYAFGTYNMWHGAPSTFSTVTNYTVGTLIIDAVDTHNNKLVFRGTATAVIGGQRDSARKIRRAVAEMAATFPVLK
ncbi:MAG: DUF4136 domain-containing protein [Chthoniobacterales bacterium]